MNRQENNKKILESLSALVDVYPDMRFGQILSNFVLERGKDIFHEEPNVTLRRILERHSDSHHS
jgi:hypothetical protein